MENGLPQNTVYAVVQDQQGFLWLGTQQGLCRYDGFSFRNYTSDPNTPDSLSGRTVTNLLVDSKNRLWAGTQGDGLNRFDRLTASFVHYRHDPEDPNSISSDMISALIEDKHGAIWVGTENGLNCLNPAGDTWTRYHVSDGLPHHFISALAEDRKGRIWIGTQEGLSCLDETRTRFTHWQQGNEHELIHNHVRSILCVGELIYIGTARGMSIYDPQAGRFHAPRAAGPHKPREIDVLHCDDRGRIWLGTTEGLYRYDPATHRFASFLFHPNDPHGISGNIISSITQDAGGIIWVGTEANGINKLNPYSERMLHIGPDRGFEDGLPFQVIIDFYEDRKGRFWITSDGGGIFQFNPETGRFLQNIRHDPNNPNSPLDDYLWTISEDNQGRFWIPSRQGVNCFDPDEGKWHHYSYDPNNERGLSFNRCFSAVVDGENRVWVGTFGGGLNLLTDERMGTFRHFRHDPTSSRSLSSDLVLVVFEDRDRRLWVGTFGAGLNLFDESRGDFRVFKNDPNDPSSLPEDSVGHLYQDSKSRLWISTGRGLALYRPESGTFSSFGTEQGLKNDVTYAVIEDDMGYLWVSTNEGISRFDPLKQTFINYMHRHNLQSPEFNQLSVYKRKGLLYFGGVNGFNIFDPSEVDFYKHPPSAVLTEIRRFNEPFPLETPIEELRELTLTHKDQMMSFAFAGLDFLDPIANRYAYELVGFTPDRIELGNKHDITFTNLDPGEYTLRIHTANPDGFWNPEPFELALNVVPPPWLSPFAFVGYGLLVLSLIGGGWWIQQRRLERARRLNERLRRVDRLKDEFLANTSHELRTPLNGMIGIAESLLEGAAGKVSGRMSDNLNLIVTNGRRLENIISDLLDFSRMKHQSLRLEMSSVDVAAVIQVVLTICRPMLDRKSILLTCQVPDNLPLVVADENRLQQILFNLLDNAVKFTHEGEISVCARLDGGRVIVSVSDTGIGIPKEHLDDIFVSFQQLDGSTGREYGGAGLGLAVTRQLVELHQGNLTVESLNGKGSCFSFDLEISDGALPRTNGPIQPAVTSAYDGGRELEGPESTDNDRFHVLVVDDERVNRQILLNLLRVKGYRTTLAKDGEEALEFLESHHRFDLVLLDIMMPRVTGYDVCRHLRRRFSLQELPVIFLTAKNQTADLRHGFELGANDYLSKPFSKDELLSRVHLHLTLLDTHRNMEALVAERTHKLEDQYHELETLNSIVQAINNETSMTDLFNVLLEEGVRLFPQAESASFLRVTPDRKYLRVVAVHGYDIKMTRDIRMTLDHARGRYTEGTEELERGIYIVRNPDEKSRPASVRSLPQPMALLAMQVDLNGALEGYLVLDHSKSAHGFTSADVQRLMRFREHAVSALKRARMLENLARSQQDLVEAAHMFGMADNASMVLHNMGNKLNSVNTSLQMVREHMDRARWVPVMQRVRDLMNAQSDLMAWLSDETRAKKFPTTMAQLLDRVGDWKHNLSDEVHRVETLIEEVLDVLRAQWDYTAIRAVNEPADLVQLLEGCARQQLARRKNPIKIVDKMEPMPLVSVQKVLLMRVFFCLLENAVEAIEASTPSGGGVLVLRIYPKGNHALVEVEDNGIGIEAENLEKLFIQGYTTKSSTTVSFGLHNCANIVAGMGGTLTIHSKGIGQGTQAILKLPLDSPLPTQ